jgi:predicted metal-binding membrane protein
VESASVRQPPRLPGLIQVGLIGGLLLLAALGWAVTDVWMRGMDAGPGTPLGALGFYVAAWVVMMAAMMFPSVWPMVTMYVRVQAGRRRRGRRAAAGATPLFVSGYLVIWTVAGLTFYAVFAAGHALDIEALAWDRAGRYVAGAVVLAAAVYQLTPLKDACLSKCRSPFAFLITAWRPGLLGALRMGAQHGAWCVGCCWALMAALFALGVMSVGWMAFIAALIATEKLFPWKAIANRGIAVVLVVLGLAVAIAPEDVPGLTIPGSGGGMEGMGTDATGAMGSGASTEPTQGK